MPAWAAWEKGCKRLSLIWHRRAGKDDIALHAAAVAAHERIGNYWHMLPEYSQARKAIWNAVNPHTGLRRIDEAFPREVRESTNDQEMFIRFRSGSTWQVIGSDNYKSLVGTPPIGIVFSEWAKANPGAWAYLAPILSENGGWAKFITTPEGKNHAYTMHRMARDDPGWHAETLTVEDTGAISLDIIEQQRKEYHSIYGIEQGDALIEQEYWCSFTAAILGAVYGSEMRIARQAGRITIVPYDPKFPVHTAWDIGRTDATAIWWYQVIAGEVRVLKCHASTLKNVAYYLKLLRGQTYEYGYHWLPHDAKAKTLAAAGKSVQQQLAEGTRDDQGAWVSGMGIDSVAIAPRLSEQDGLQAARAMFPRCYFDEEGCEDYGIPALESYKYEWDEENKKFRGRPKHDWSSNPADAFRMLALVWQAERQEPPPPPKPRYAIDATIGEIVEWSDRHEQPDTRV